MSEYYVYAYINPLESGQFQSSNVSFLFKPFYIGKGKGTRLFDHLKEARPTRKFKNSHKLNTIRAIQKQGVNPIIIKICENLSDSDAIVNELSLILELKIKYGLSNIRTSTWVSSKNINKKTRKHNNPRKGTITIYNNTLKEHSVIKDIHLEIYKTIFGSDNIINTSKLNFRKKPKQQKARLGNTNRMFGKSAVKGKKWCIVNGKEQFLFPYEVEKLLESNYNVEYGRIYKPKGKRIIFEGELKGKYRTDDDISYNPTVRYQYSLIWSPSKDTFINHKKI